MIEVTRTYDVDLVREIMTRPEIWETIAEDGQAPRDFKPDAIAECWLLMKVKGQTVALYNLHVRNSITLEIHAQVLPEYRKDHSWGTGVAALQWIHDYAHQYDKVIACVPQLYENVKKFTCSFGFQVEGVNRLSYLKNDVIHDQWMLGITREEIKVFLDDQSS